MKATPFAIAALALCTLLCSCAENDGDVRLTESVTVSLTETSEVSAAGTTAAEKKLLGDYTETSPAKTEPEPESREVFSVYDLREKADGEYVRLCCPLDKRRVCLVCETAGGESGYNTQSFRVIDISTGEKLWEKDIAEDRSSSFSGVLTDTGDALFRIFYDVYRQNEDGAPDYSAPPDSSVTYVYGDFTSVTTDPAETSLSDIAFLTGKHMAAQSGVNITDENGKVLAAGYTDTETPYGWYTRTPYFCFPAGDERFVYKTIGYERWYNMGVYDFETDAAADISGTESLYPFGYHEGKIFSYASDWDAWGGVNELYTTDIETFETVRRELPCPEPEKNQFYSFSMPESGEYIIAVRAGDLYSDDPAYVFVIDPDTFEVTAEYALDEFESYAFPSVVYADSSIFMLWERDRGTLLTFPSDNA